MQNLNSFILDYIGIFLIFSFATIGVVFLWFTLKSKNNEIRDVFLQTQGELAGRLALLNESNIREQNRLLDALNDQKLTVLKMVDEKLLAVTKSVGEGLQQNTVKTNQTLTDLRERLAKIDVAQQKISSLSEQVVS